MRNWPKYCKQWATNKIWTNIRVTGIDNKIINRVHNPIFQNKKVDYVRISNQDCQGDKNRQIMVVTDTEQIMVVTDTEIKEITI